MPNLSNIVGGRYLAVVAIALILTLIAGACAESAWSPSSQADSENRLATSINPGGATATLGLRIYLSDVVVRARFVSGGDGNFSFRAIEYLKGSGSSDFEVIDERAGGNPKWSLHEAVLLLSMPEEDEETLDPGDATKFIFTDTVAQNYDAYGEFGFPRLPYGYSIETRNPVWLPAVERAADSSTPDDDLRFYTDQESPTGIVLPSVSLAEIRSKIAWQDKRADIEGYDRCVDESLSYEQWSRDREGMSRTTALEMEHWSPFGVEIMSGMAKGVVIGDSLIEDEGYPRVWIEDGPHARFFEAFIVDDDDNPENGFIPVDATARPLPQGVYSIWSRNQPQVYRPCDFDPLANGIVLEVTVTAPPGTWHEAFFDPATLPNGSGVGASGGTGVIDPARFKSGNADAEILGLTWSDDKIVLTGNENLSLYEDSLDFIDVDGSIRMSLHVANATRDRFADIYTWDVPEQPWQDGDLLMLRIRQTNVGATIISQVRDLTIPTPTGAPEITRTPATLAHPDSSQSGPIWIFPFLAVIALISAIVFTYVYVRRRNRNN